MEPWEHQLCLARAGNDPYLSNMPWGSLPPPYFHFFLPYFHRSDYPTMRGGLRDKVFEYPVFQAPNTSASIPYLLLIILNICSKTKTNQMLVSQFECCLWTLSPCSKAFHKPAVILPIFVHSFIYSHRLNFRLFSLFSMFLLYISIHSPSSFIHFFSLYTPVFVIPFIFINSFIYFCTLHSLSFSLSFMCVHSFI